MDNIEYLLNNIKRPELDKELNTLLTFTSNPKLLNSINTITKGKNPKEYIYKYRKTDYPFSIFTDQNIQEYDKKILLENREASKLSRILKLTGSLTYNNLRLLIGISSIDELRLLIAYSEEGKEKVIDYESNLIMNKKDYEQLFSFIKINEVSKSEIYILYWFLNEFGNDKNIWECLLFTEEIFNDAMMKKTFPFLKEKYDKAGFVFRNYFLWRDKSDSLFFTSNDYQNMPFEIIRKKIDDFTRDGIETKNINYDKETKKYCYKTESNNVFEFKLISDCINNEEMKSELLSDKRYRKCHPNVHRIANMIPEGLQPTTYIVAGKIAANEVDYFLHSWVEVESRNVVIDFNHNIVMDKEHYYKLYGAKVLNKTTVTEMKSIVKTLINQADLLVSCLDINYFGKELKRDLVKNKHIFEKR